MVCESIFNGHVKTDVGGPVHGSTMLELQLGGTKLRVRDFDAGGAITMSLRFFFKNKLTNGATSTAITGSSMLQWRVVVVEPATPPTVASRGRAGPSHRRELRDHFRFPKGLE